MLRQGSGLFPLQEIENLMMPKCSYVLTICTYDSLQIANFNPKTILLVIHLVKEHELRLRFSPVALHAAAA